MIPKHALACLLLVSSFISLNPSFAATTGGMNASDTRLGALETKIFSHAYKNDSDADRVARLEKFVFSGIKTEGSLNDRISSLTSAVNVRNVGDEPYLPKRRPFAEWAPSGVAAPQARAAAPRNLSNYPRVTELEQKLFGQTFSGEPVASRLDRLERREYGRTSNSTDLAMRVDSLVSSVMPTPSLASIRLANYRPGTSSYTSSGAGDYKTNFFGLNRSPEIASGVRGTQSYTVVDQIEFLENATFGRIHPNKTLQKRVDALEEKFYGAQKPESTDLSSRVAHLWSAANVANRSTSSLNRGA